jgi:microcin C transport system substrate-binding protein
MMKYILLLIANFVVSTHAEAAPKHALTLFEQPKYAPNFKHFEYANPNAPKGGDVKLYHPMNFDSLNPFILKGVAAPAINLTYDTLMTQSFDEPQTFYPLIAKAVELAEDKRKITYFLDERAKFSDGSKVTTADIVFSFDILKNKGHPLYKLRFSDIEKAEISGKNAVTFYFNKNSKNRDLPFITAGLPVLAKKFYDGKAFDKTSLEAPLASGAYLVKDFEIGRFITYSRNHKYWAHEAGIASRNGFFNFDNIRYDLYRDETVALEAFKAHQYDLREEYIARNWALSYDFPASRNGEVIIDNTPHQIPRGLQGFIFNVRKGKFKDRRVREAIGLTFDFEWMNKTLFYDAYARNNSLFQSTPFAARELPTSDELELLEPYRDILPEDAFNKVYNPPITDGTGFIRTHLIKADKLLNEAGWVIKDGIRVNYKTGEPLIIEVLSRQKSLDKVVAAMQRNLKTLGIEIKSRTVDESQYQKRVESFDFDMVTIWWNMGLIYPGNEQESFWDCKQAKVHASQNMSGYCNKAVDKLLENISGAEDYQTLLTSARALDLVIMSEHIIIPHFSISTFRMAYWDIFGIPKFRPPYERAFDTWWIKKK